MPELPDVVVYIESLSSRVAGQPLQGVRLATPFLLRTVDPSLASVRGKIVRGFSRLGKRIVFELEDDLFLVLHLMIAGRLRWRPPAEKIPGKVGLAAFDFPNGALLLTEASTKKRASLHLVRGRQALAAFDRGGLEPLGSSLKDFRAALTSENRTLKRALTDPRIFSGIGNAYSDEILFSAKLSPVQRTHQLDDDEVKRLHVATQQTLTEWTERLRKDAAEAFPEKVTAFREDMAVHGRYQKPCPVCGTKVQRVRFADNELNYCPRCQTGGKLLADRSLSRLLRGDWPRSIDELEQQAERRVAPAEPPRAAAPRAPKRKAARR
jgi:formamidopyrimidine-DNA glycosylase